MNRIKSILEFTAGSLIISAWFMFVAWLIFIAPIS